MLYWEERGDKISLAESRILSLKKAEGGRIRFREECDRYFCVYVTNEEAVSLLEEAIAWIKFRD